MLTICEAVVFAAAYPNGNFKDVLYGIVYSLLLIANLHCDRNNPSTSKYYNIPSILFGRSF